MLPRFEQDPGPLHTLLQDADGNIYYTDEINHILAALTAAGEIRWHRGGRGNGMCEFHYPKGMELGWITENHGKTRCIAVCDSWNRRIQFFDLDGGFLSSWKAAGELPFSDAVDIRFLDASGADEDRSFWVVLDRGHHCLLGLDLAGLPLFRIGQPFYENLEPKWPTPNSVAAEPRHPVDLIRESSSYDPLFMPLRIFGSSQEALFIWEPNSRRLKQVFLGNLLPVWIEPPAGAEWIGADEEGLLAFNKATSLISFCDFKSRIWRCARVEGVPVPGGCSTREIWMQNGSLVQHFSHNPDAQESTAQSGIPNPWALGRLSDEMKRAFRLENPPHGIAELKEIVYRMYALGEKAQNLSNLQSLDTSGLQSLRDNLLSAQPQFSGILLEMRGFTHTLFLALLKVLQIRSLHPAITACEHFKRAVAPLLASTLMVSDLFVELLRFRDQWILTAPSRSAPADGTKESTQLWNILMEEFAATPLRAMVELAKWSWFVPAADALINMPDSRVRTQKSADSNGCPGLLLAPPHSRSRRSSGYFRELDRIFLGSTRFPSPVRPAALVRSQDGHLLVTLQNAHQVMRLTEQGEVLGTMDTDPAEGKTLREPAGIAIDDIGRVWISEPQNHCIKIFDPRAHRFLTLDELAGIPLNLRYPFGIHKADNGSMLIADTMNNRVLVASTSGKIRVLCNREGTNLGEFRHPISFCATNSEGTVWVVDLRNHRLQKLSLDGVPLQEIGGPGLGMGRFVLPEHSVIFEDGVLVVGQWACIKALKVFSPEGDELDTIHLDYSPRGMLVHQGRLLVCSGSGDHIYVYERT